MHGRALIDLRAAEAAMTARYAPGNPDLQAGPRPDRGAAGSAGRRPGQRDRPCPPRCVQQMQSEMVMGRAQLAPLAAEQARYEALVAGSVASCTGWSRPTWSCAPPRPASRR